MHKGLVIAHLAYAKLTNVKFKVSEAGRQRVIKEKRKNVHAFIEGDWDENITGMFDQVTLKRVSYNPYQSGNFVSDNLPIYSAEIVYLTDVGAFVPLTNT